MIGTYFQNYDSGKSIWGGPMILSLILKWGKTPSSVWKSSVFFVVDQSLWVPGFPICWHAPGLITRGCPVKKNPQRASVFEVPTRARSEEVSNWLQMKGVKAPSISNLLLLVKLVKKGDLFFFWDIYHFLEILVSIIFLFIFPLLWWLK